MTPLVDQVFGMAFKFTIALEIFFKKSSGLSLRTAGSKRKAL